MLTAILFLLLQLLSMVVFFNRYIAGIAVKFLKKEAFQDADYRLQPTVTVVVPMFNEGKAIQKTLESLLALDYPHNRLDIAVIDDCSTDLSLRGMPVFRGLIGPMPEGRTTVRYESPDVFETLTKEWSSTKSTRKPRRRMQKPEGLAASELDTLTV